MLKMKKHCEKCNTATGEQDTAFICSYECTFCETCTTAMNAICPNCSGELLRRPRRLRKPLEVAASQIKQRVFGK